MQQQNDNENDIECWCEKCHDHAAGGEGRGLNSKLTQNHGQGSRTQETVCWALLTSHMIMLLVLIRQVSPNAIQCGQLCLLLTVIFVFVRHRSTRLFSFFSSYAGLAVLSKSAIQLIRAYKETSGAVAVALQITARTLTASTGDLHASQVSLRDEKRSIHHKLLLHVLLAFCFGVAQAANLTLYISERRRIASNRNNQEKQRGSSLPCDV